MSYRIPQHCPHKPTNITNNHPKIYNLDIRNYSFEELLALFDLDMNLTLEDLRRAKKKVLMIHPDKSKLPPDYFLFYKKAFEIVVNYYESISKSTNSLEHDVKYTPTDQFKLNTNTKEQITSMKPEEFNSRFNSIYEQNVAKNIDQSKYQWFKEDQPVFEQPSNVSASNLGSTFENMKQKQREMGLMKYTGVHELRSGYNTSSFYDDDESNDQYISCDPFSKLKFDDLRKVHKDQTIFNVSESDIRNRPTYNSVEEYKRANQMQYVVPDEDASRKILEMRQKAEAEAIAKKRYEQELRMMEMAKKNESFLSSFLRLT